MILSPFEVQIEDQGQAGAQVLQVASTSQQDLQGISTVQFVQQGELTEEQQQQVQDGLQLFHLSRIGRSDCGPAPSHRSRHSWLLLSLAVNKSS